MLQAAEVAFRGQLVGVVVAETSETARQAADAGRASSYDERPHDVELRADHPDLYTPEQGQPRLPDRHRRGRRRRGAGRRARSRVDADLHAPPMEHNNPMEPHATTALWDASAPRAADAVRLHPGRAPRAQATIAQVFGLDAGAGAGRSARTSAAASAPRARRTPTRPGRAGRRAAARPAGASWRSPASRCSPSSATAPRPSSGCGSAPTATAG